MTSFQGPESEMKRIKVKRKKKVRNEANSKKSYVIFEERRKHMEKHWRK